MLLATLSPIGDAFRTRLLMFPALVNCCTIDWFTAWPEEALRSVAKYFLDSVSLDDEVRAGLVDGVIDAIATDHAPHAEHEKDVEFTAAPFGVTGFETALPVCLDLVREGELSPLELVRRMSSQYRMTGKQLPTAASFFVADVLDPLKAFLAASAGRLPPDAAAISRSSVSAFSA